LENLIMNPTLADLVGGIQAVTLGDEEARRRGTQKSVLERKAPPTFDVVVEILDFNRVAIHSDVTEAVDSILRGRPVTTETRWLDENHELQKQVSAPKKPAVAHGNKETKEHDIRPQKVYPFGVNRSKLEQVAREIHLPLTVVAEMEDAELVVTSKNYYRRKAQKLRDAEAAGIPIYVLKSSTTAHVRQMLSATHSNASRAIALRQALEEAEEAVGEIDNGMRMVELAPQNAYIRRLQHILAQKHQLSSSSRGEGQNRRVVIFKGATAPKSDDVSPEEQDEE
jgi:hypothetical protein